MYSRQNDRNRDIRIPRNYNGNVIFSDPRSDIPTKQHVPKDQPFRRRYADYPEESDRERQAQTDAFADIEDERELKEAQDIAEENNNAALDEAQEAKPVSILSPIGALGTEELLLIALALIIFQGGKEPELALLLLALLFIN